MTSHIINKWSKLSQKEYKTTYEWLGKVIHRELCKKCQFDYMNKLYVHNPKSILENETDKFLSDFEMKTDHLVSTRRPDLIIIKKENLQDCGPGCPGWPQSKT